MRANAVECARDGGALDGANHDGRAHVACRHVRARRLPLRPRTDRAPRRALLQIRKANGVFLLGRLLLHEASSDEAHPDGGDGASAEGVASAGEAVAAPPQPTHPNAHARGEDAITGGGGSGGGGGGGGQAAVGGLSACSADTALVAHVLRALRFVFSTERNRKIFRRLFPPDLFAAFIDVTPRRKSLPRRHAGAPAASVAAAHCCCMPAASRHRWQCLVGSVWSAAFGRHSVWSAAFGRQRHAGPPHLTAAANPRAWQVGHFVRELERYAPLAQQLQKLPPDARQRMVEALADVNVVRGPSRHYVKDYAVQELLGKGAFGSVYQVKKDSGETPYAMKELPMDAVSAIGNEGDDKDATANSVRCAADSISRDGDLPRGDEIISRGHAITSRDVEILSCKYEVVLLSLCYLSTLSHVSPSQVSPRGDTWRTLPQVRREVEILSTLHHPNIIRYYESFHQGNALCSRTRLLEPERTGGRCATRCAARCATRCATRCAARNRHRVSSWSWPPLHASHSEHLSHSLHFYPPVPRVTLVITPYCARHCDGIGGGCDAAGPPERPRREERADGGGATLAHLLAGWS